MSVNTLPIHKGLAEVVATGPQPKDNLARLKVPGESRTRLFRFDNSQGFVAGDTIQIAYSLVPTTIVCVVGVDTPDPRDLP